MLSLLNEVVLNRSKRLRWIESKRSCKVGPMLSVLVSRRSAFNPLRPNSDLSETSHCNIKGLSVREVMRIENMITQVKFY